MKSMNPGSGRIGGCPGTGYTKSRTTPTLSFEGTIASLMHCTTSVGGALHRRVSSLRAMPKAPSGTGEAHGSLAVPPSTYGRHQ